LTRSSSWLILAIGTTQIMPEWLKGMVPPTLMLWLCAVALGVAYAVAPDGQLPGRADFASRLALPLVIAVWVNADARKRGKALCYDYDSFVFFIWPFMVPVYLYQTRGMRALVTLLCFAGIWLVAMAPFIVVSTMRELSAQ
jgi:hypothetical protein